MTSTIFHTPLFTSLLCERYGSLKSAKFDSQIFFLVKAEEDDFDDDEEEFVNEPTPSKKAVVEDDLEDAVVEDVDSEFNHLMDEEEFEGFNTEEEEEEDEFEHMSTKGIPIQNVKFKISSWSSRCKFK